MFRPVHRTLHRRPAPIDHHEREAEERRTRARRRERFDGLASSVCAAVLAMSVSLAAVGFVAAQETAVAPEKNPPGDIPDDQVFVAFDAPQGFALKVPEGWGRAERADGVAFSDKYGRVDVTIATAPVPTVASVRDRDVPALERAGRAVEVRDVQAVRLPSGPGVRISYTENSEANPVTGKRIRLESERTLIPHAGKLAALTFSAPAGADNIDQWKLMADSFRWR